MVGIAEFQCWKIHNLFPAASTTGTTGSKERKITSLCSWEENLYLLSTEGETGSRIKNQGRVLTEQLLLLVSKCLVNGVVAFGGNLCTEGNKNGWKLPYCGIRRSIDL